MNCALKIIAKASSQIWDDRLKIILVYRFRGASRQIIKTAVICLKKYKYQLKNSKTILLA